jgi:hypothetical protein
MNVFSCAFFTLAERKKAHERIEYTLLPSFPSRMRGRPKATADDCPCVNIAAHKTAAFRKA